MLVAWIHQCPNALIYFSLRNMAGCWCNLHDFSLLLPPLLQMEAVRYLFPFSLSLSFSLLTLPCVLCCGGVCARRAPALYHTLPVLHRRVTKTSSSKHASLVWFSLLSCDISVFSLGLIENLFAQTSTGLKMGFQSKHWG